MQLLYFFSKQDLKNFNISHAFLLLSVAKLSTFNKSPLPLTYRVTQCLRPTVLYTDVDNQCDKVVTETVTSLPDSPFTYFDST